jgi:hypothetical protein
MPRTSTAATKETWTGRPESAAAGLTRRTPRTTAQVMPLWQGLALLFAPVKGSADR